MGNATGQVQCSTCGEFHDIENMEVAFDSPDAYLQIPTEERNTRVKLNADFCVIDGVRFFIRGVVPVPVDTRDRDYCWGVWAEIDEPSFELILKTWNDDDVSHLDPIPGSIANTVPEYEDSLGLAVTLELRVDTRPFMRIVSESAFRSDQEKGVGLDAVSRYYHYVA